MIKLENLRFFAQGLTPREDSNGVYGFAKNLAIISCAA